MLPLRLGAALFFFSQILLLAPDAEACGGFFCSNVPVVQTGEEIVFAVDHEAGTVDAIIQIAYQGAAEDFAWVLPLVSAPLSMSVGTTRLFQRVDAQTAPVFAPRYEFADSCDRFPPSQGGGQDAAASRSDAGSDPGVVVLAQEQVGPYDSVVITSSSTDSIREWLVENNYNVSPVSIAAARPYVETGHVLLALKLSKNESVGSLQPFAVKINSIEPCIPLILTSIAAASDMEVTAVILNSRGRAVPKNFLHVQPNYAAMNWLNPYVSYRQLIRNAADESGGTAFATEFSGSPSVLANQIYFQSEYRLQEIREATTLAEVVDALLAQRLNLRSEIRGILRKNISDEILTGAGVPPDDFFRCPNCWTHLTSQIAYDGDAIAGDIDDRIVDPDRDAQMLFDAHTHLTRLYTAISPEEMSLDPQFDFDPDLPEVSRTHTPQVRFECGADGSIQNARVRVTLDDGTVFYTNAQGEPERGPLPAAAVIEDLDTGTVIRDNTDEIDEMLGDPNAGLREARDDCSCDVGARSSLPLGILFLLVIAGLGARRATFSRRAGSRVHDATSRPAPDSVDDSPRLPR